MNTFVSRYSTHPLPNTASGDCCFFYSADWWLGCAPGHKLQPLNRDAKRPRQRNRSRGCDFLPSCGTK